MTRLAHTSPLAWLAAVTLLPITAAHAGVITTSTFMFELPPGSEYLTPPGAQICYALGPGNDLCISGAILGGFSNQTWIHLPDDTRINNADVEFSGHTTSPGWALGPVAMSGFIVALEVNRATETGTFDTEMIQLSLSGLSAAGPLMIRESPTLLSPGQLTISDLGGGQYMMDSFFDVFTELSVDGGKLWYPSNGSTRFQLPGEEVPEPATLPVAASALALLAAVLRRRGRRCRASSAANPAEFRIRR